MIHVYPELEDDASAPPAAPTPWPTLQSSARLLLPAPEPPVPFERLPYQQWREALVVFERHVSDLVSNRWVLHEVNRLCQNQPQESRYMLARVPEVRLALSVLYAAAVDLLKPMGAWPREVRDWFFSCSDPCGNREHTFEWWCGIADIDPGAVRRLLMQALESQQYPASYNVFAGVEAA